MISLFSKITYVFSTVMGMASLALAFYGWEFAIRHHVPPGTYRDRMIPVLRHGRWMLLLLAALLLANAIFYWNHP